jgi:hypothetical protein
VSFSARNWSRFILKRVVIPNARVFSSGRDLPRNFTVFARDPSLRLKIGSIQDDGPRKPNFITTEKLGRFVGDCLQ